MCSHAAVIEAQLHFSPVAGDPSSNKLLHVSSRSKVATRAVTRSYPSLVILALNHTCMR